MKFITVCDPNCNVAILLKAIQVPFMLYDATIQQRIWEGAKQVHDGTIKHTHVGWCEFERVCEAFKEANRVETVIEPYVSESVRITTLFFKGKNPCSFSKTEAVVDSGGKTFILSTS